ncbi:MAG TPA: choice-of-anchor Q domain-containing protein [Verrucomicrobiae bacterium]
MTARRFHFTAAILAAATITSMATVRYVDVNNPNPATPYTTWATAANVIQHAVDAAAAGDEIVVTNGLYATGGRAVRGLTVNRVAVDRPMVVRSVNGPEATIIQGRQVAGTTNGVGAVRCVYLTNEVSLSGFTLTGGATGTEVDHSGGGVLSEGAVVTNCVIVGNTASSYGGGVYGASRLFNCLIISNSASAGGGTWEGSLSNCTLIGNAARSGGGAAYAWLYNCLVISNSAAISPDFGGGGGGTYGSFLYNCTVVGNSGSGASGLLFYPVGAMSALYNCILFHNSCSAAEQYSDIAGSKNGIRAQNCCVTPQSGWDWQTNNENCFARDPRFVDEAAGDLRLRSDSPCINAGLNDYAPAGTDFDGNPRIVGGAVDIGAFEFQSPQSTMPYWWLQQYALPTDGSADLADTDSDGHNNWQEWRADTVPTNALSRLALIAPTNAPGGLAVTWQSVPTRSYFLQRGTDLAGTPALLTLATNIPGQAGTTTFTDTTATNGGPFFYRVGVQQ